MHGANGQIIMHMYTHSRLRKLKMTFLSIWHIHTRGKNQYIRQKDSTHTHSHTRKIEGFVNIHRHIPEEESYLSIYTYACDKEIISINVCTWREIWLVYIHVK